MASIGSRVRFPDLIQFVDFGSLGLGNLGFASPVSCADPTYSMYISSPAPERVHRARRCVRRSAQGAKGQRHDSASRIPRKVRTVKTARTRMIGTQCFFSNAPRIPQVNSRHDSSIRGSFPRCRAKQFVLSSREREALFWASQEQKYSALHAMSLCLLSLFAGHCSPPTLSPSH